MPKLSIIAVILSCLTAAPALAESASRFAAQSEAFAKLPREERKLLDEFVKVLKAEA